MKKFLLATTALAAMAAPVMAADLPVKAPPVVAAVYSWTGCYIGGNVGIAHTRLDNRQVVANGTPGYFAVAVLAEVGAAVSGRASDTTFTGGAHAGCNYQSGRVVWGLETDISWLRADPVLGGRFLYSTNSAPYFNTAQLDTRWLWTVRGRLGITYTERVMLYGTGGLAVARVNYNQTFTEPPFTVVPGSVSAGTRTGWVAGVGAEAALSGNWVGRIEYLHTQLWSDNLVSTTVGGGGDNATFTNRVRIDIDTIRFGLSYKLGPTPVVARY